MIYRSNSALLIGAILVPVLSSVAVGANTTWTFNGSGGWEDSAKWSNGAPVNSTFDVAIDDGDSAATVTLDTVSRTINSLTLGTDDAVVVRESSSLLSAALTVANGFTNSGTIRLAGSNTNIALTSFSALTVSTGTLTNNGTGLMHFQSGGVGTRRFTGDMTNQGGMIQIDAPTTFNKTNGLVEQTSGITNLNNTLTLDNGSQFKLSGGTLNVGSGTVSGGLTAIGAFNLSGGTLSAALTLDNVGLTVGSSMTSPFSISIQGTNFGNGVPVTLSNNLLSAGQTLTLQTTPPLLSGAVVTSAAGFTNQGSIILIPGINTTFWITSSDLLTNGATGLIRVTPLGGAPLSRLRANILNQGTVSIEAPTIFEKMNATFTNIGQFTMSAGFSFDAGRTFSQTGGTSRINATLGSPTANMPAQFSGGRLLGVGALFVPVVNSGASVEPGDNGVGKLSISGSYTQQSGGSLIAELGGTGTNQFDVLTVVGPATLAGTLDVRLANLGGGTFSPAAGDSFQILTTTGGVANQFENLLLPPLNNNLSWNVIYSANAVSLSVSAVPEPATVMLGFAGMMMTVLFRRTTRMAILQ